MKRRNFTKNSAWIGLGLLASTLAWRRVLGQAPADSIREGHEAWQRARTRGVPLIVMVIPGDETAAWERGRAWGIFLNHGAAEILAAFAQVEVVCLRIAELAEVFPSTVLPVGEPLIVRFQQAPAATHASDHVETEGFDAPLPTPGPSHLTPEGEMADDQQYIDQTIEVIRGLVQRALIGQLQHLTAETRSRAIQETHRRFIAARIPGSYWATQNACGIRIESPPPSPTHRVTFIACGMGHTPERARRFLHFFVGRASGDEW